MLCCSGGSRGGFWGGCPPLFLDQTEAQRAKKKWGGDRAFPPYFRVWIWHCVALVEEDKTEAGRAKKKLGGKPGPPPLFQGLDLALCCFGGGRQSGRTFILMPFMIKK